MVTQRFYTATDKLMHAFIMGTIKHSYPCSCAVGILCDGSSDWQIFQHHNGNIQMTFDGINAIAPSYYSQQEIFEIEKVFEERPTGFLDVDWDSVTDSRFNIKGKLNFTNDRDCFKGLSNVFDYMVTLEDWSEQEKGADIFELLKSITTQ